jgi:hypothetical protein
MGPATGYLPLGLIRSPFGPKPDLISLPIPVVMLPALCTSRMIIASSSLALFLSFTALSDRWCLVLGVLHG